MLSYSGYEPDGRVGFCDVCGGRVDAETTESALALGAKNIADGIIVFGNAKPGCAINSLFNSFHLIIFD